MADLPRIGGPQEEPIKPWQKGCALLLMAIIVIGFILPLVIWLVRQAWSLV